ncbi:MAG: scyllo-inositol 2-dehydrogenase [Gaiellaceae bacterium]|nr:scyllo-inositol 2-dehydrogenase [Gaiellaceae bacterium]
MRVGVAGLGGMGVVHARNALAADGIELTAVAAARPGRAAEAAVELGSGARPCTYDELFAADDVDAVVLAARSIDHARLAQRVLEHGKHLLLEKPGATSTADHAALREAAAAAPELVVQVAYMRRYDTGFVEAHRLVSEGAVGTPLLVLLTSRDTEWPEGENPHETGGFLLDMAVHDYDTACWLLGEEPVEVHAARQARVYPELDPLGDLDNGLVTIRFDGGALATTHVSRTCVYGHDIRCEVVGTEGSVLVGNAASRDGVTLLRRSDGSLFADDYRDRFADAYRAELEAFAAACAGSGPPGPGLAEDARAVAIGVAARASAVGGGPLAVGPDWPWPA